MNNKTDHYFVLTVNVEIMIDLGSSFVQILRWSGRNGFKWRKLLLLKENTILIFPTNVLNIESFWGIILWMWLRTDPLNYWWIFYKPNPCQNRLFIPNGWFFFQFSRHSFCRFSFERVFPHFVPFANFTKLS